MTHARARTNCGVPFVGAPLATKSAIAQLVERQAVNL